MSTAMQDGRRKLTWDDRVNIAKRYAEKEKTGDTSVAIARDFNISRHWVPVIARRMNEKAPGSDQQPGH